MLQILKDLKEAEIWWSAPKKVWHTRQEKWISRV